MPSSCCQITRSTGLAPRPPYSLGQCRQTQPPSDFFFCHAFATSTISCFCSLMRPSEDLESSASNWIGALAPIHRRASARNAASCAVSSKFMVNLFCCIGWVDRPVRRSSENEGGRRNPPSLRRREETVGDATPAPPCDCSSFSPG